MLKLMQMEIKKECRLIDRETLLMEDQESL